MPAIAFQHIPPQEFYDCLTEVPAWTPNAVEGARTHAGHCYVLNDAVCRPGSRLGEAIGCADENVEQVEAMRQAGGYFALFCGHDHKNAFVGHAHGMDLGYAPTCEAMRQAGGYFALFCGHDHKNAFVGHAHGMDLGYAPTCGFECYGPKSRLRGVRLFEFHESDPAAYETRMLTWDDLIGRYSRNELRVFFEDHCITDAIGLRNELRRPSVLATLAGLGAAAFDLIGRYSRNELRVFFEDHCITDAIGLRNELRRPSVLATLAGLGAAALVGVAAMITRLFKR